MAIQWGDALARLLARYYSAPSATTTTIKAIPANGRDDGMVLVCLADSSIWIFDAGSSASASSTVLVPDAGTGRWLKVGVADGVPAEDLAATTNGDGASLVGVEDADDLLTATTVEGALAELAAVRIHKVSDTFTHEDLDAEAGSQVLSLGDALPANAYVLSREIRLTTAFSGGGAGQVTMDIGGTDADCIVDGADVFTGAPAAQAGASGVNPNGKLGGQQLTVTIAADVDVDDLTAGSATVDVLYVVLA